MISAAPTSYRQKKWLLPDLSEADLASVQSLAQQLRLPPLIAGLLFTRQIPDPAAFLEPRFRDLCSPGLLPNIHPAASRIAAAVREHHKITLYGDYDVDGITGTAMLWHTLKTAGANVEYYIPHRVDEGYGLSAPAIEKLIADGTQLLITVDCGCSAVEPITRARSLGIDTVVSDHHEFAPTLPPAFAIVHPRFPLSTQHSSLSTPYPNPDLCGAGVAFKLAWAIAQKLCNSERVNETYRNLLVEFSALVALGTVADVVPLTGENRILVKYGLSQLLRTRFDGLRALIQAAGYGTQEGGVEGKKLDCMAIGFTLGPRLNAAGRMGHAREAVELLTTAEGQRADEIAALLESQNRDRQKTEKSMTKLAHEEIKNQKSKIENPYILVAAHESFHAGVVGIVASRLVDQFHRPAFVLAKTAPSDANPHPECHGSARSIPGFQLHHAIDHVRDLLISGGGHAMAGGVRLLLSNLGAFTNRLNAFALDHLTEDQLIPSLPIDGILTLADCTPHTLTFLDKLEPFGRGNPQPRFLLQNVRLTAPPRRVGSAGTHLQLTITQNNRAARCIAFRMGDLEPQLPTGTQLHLVVEPTLQSWQGRPQVNLSIIDLAKSSDEPFH